MTMCRRITDLTAFLELGLFEGIEESMYRLETLQTYDVAYERARYDAFLAGEPADMAPGPWQEMIRRHTAARRRVERVHIVFDPLTDYLVYELATTYPRSAAAGERIGIIGTTPGQWPAGVPTTDYWLFDDRDLWIMEYDPQGRFVAAEQASDPERIQSAVRGKRAALAASTPVAEYKAAHPLVCRRVS